MTDVLQPPPGFEPDLPWPDDIPARMSLAEYLAWDYEGVHAEWVAGTLVAMAPERLSYLKIRWFLAFLLTDYCRLHESGQAFFAPVRLQLLSQATVREPDLVFIAAIHADRLKETYIEGPADLVVEIISPESDQRDRSEKFQEYEAAGVPEYWLIDPLRHEALFYVLGEDARYHLRLPSPESVYTSVTLEGFRLRPDWLWRKPLPSPEAALAELPA